MARPRPFSFAPLFAGNWLAYASYGVLLAVLPIAELGEGGGPLLATLVLGAPLLAQTVASWGWGWLGDRIGARRSPLVVGALLQAPLFLVFPLLGPLALFAVRIAQSALFGSVVLATTQATEDPSASAAFRLGRLQLSQNGGMLLGVAAAFPFLVGATFRLDSPAGWALSALLAGFAIASGLVFARAGEPVRTPPATSPSPFAPSTHPRVFALAGATTAVSTARYVAATAIPVYLATTLGTHGFFGVSANATEQLAIWVAVSSLANLAASPFSGRWAETVAGRRQSLLAFALVYAVIWAAITWVPTYPVVFAVWCMPVAVFFTVAGVREAAELSRPNERGRAVGLLSAAFNLGGLLGGAAAGLLLAESVPVPTIFLVAALGSLASATLFIPAVLHGGGRSSPGDRDPSRPDAPS
ncbi:MAG TPA: MFS transporter [Thermoplasmata archaeon]|nr:MFS transporter [Thermoplasmata archaeon]